MRGTDRLQENGAGHYAVAGGEGGGGKTGDEGGGGKTGGRYFQKLSFLRQMLWTMQLRVLHIIGLMVSPA